MAKLVRTLHQDVTISARYIYYAARQVEGTTNTDSGAVMKDAIGVLAKQGAVEESVWPYKAGEFAAQPPAAVDTATRWLIAQTKSLKGLDEIKNALADDGPVVVGIEMYQEGMSSQTSKTGAIPLPQKGSQLLGGHAIVPDRHVLPKLRDKTQLVKENYKNRNPAQRGHGTLRLAQDQPLLRQQGADLARN